MNPIVSDSAAMASPELWVTLLKSAAMLSIVLALLIGVLFLMRRLFYGNARVSDRGLIRTVASSYVAPKERIVLIEVLGEMVLLGVTPQAINCLAKIPADSRLEIPEPSDPDRFFSNFLKNALSGRYRRNDSDNLRSRR
jgi:flagellar protein FliO/FliZ